MIIYYIILYNNYSENTHDEHYGRIAIVHPVRYPYRKYVSRAGLSVNGPAHTDDSRVCVQRQWRTIVIVFIVTDYRVCQHRVQVGVDGFEGGHHRSDRYFFRDFILDRSARPRWTVVIFIQNRHLHLLREKQTNKI